MPSFRIADAQRPQSAPARFTPRLMAELDARRRQRERVIASLLACPGKGDRANGIGNAGR